MFSNYIRIAIRFLLKNKTFSLVNLIGLAAGTLCCLYILLYVADQKSYDKYFKNAGNIYRVDTWVKGPDGFRKSASSSPPIGPSLKLEFPEVKQYTRMVGTIGIKENLLRYRDKSFYEQDAVFVDSTFFDVFNFHFLEGDPATALAEPFSLVLLKPTADKLFGQEDPIGKSIEIDNTYGNQLSRVTGVVDESGGKSHIHANLFMNMNSGGIGSYTVKDSHWASDNFANIYIELLPGANAAALEKKLPAFLEKYGGNQLKAMGIEKSLHLQPVGAIHTTAGYDNEPTPAVSSSFLDLLVLIAALIQFIACINFMNLSTARATKRAKEVAMRKVTGARKGELLTQFIGESFLLTLIGVLISIPLLFVLLPYLNQITGSDIRLSLLSSPRIIFLLAALIAVTGLVAGSYPAFYLSSFNAIRVLRGNFTNGISASGLRRGLVVFQFVLASVMITGIMVIYRQMRYLEHKDLGFNQAQKLIFSFYTDSARSRGAVFAEGLRRLAGVKAVSRANNYPGQPVLNDWPYYATGGNIATSKDVQMMFVDKYFVRALGIHLVSGRDFREGDSSAVLINQTLARGLGLDPLKASGTLLHPQHDPGDPDYPVEIVGVIRDFNYDNLHREVKPFMLSYQGPDVPGAGAGLDKIIVSAQTSDYKGLLSNMQTLWDKDLPGVPFRFSFLDQEVQKQYQVEMDFSKIINSFTLVAILISCLGLFGLTAFSAEQRNKEIGIRKVLGASIPRIIGLLCEDYFLLVTLAMVIGIPIAWWIMSKWLQGFAYRISISWWIFGLAGLVALLIAGATISFQAIRAATANPVRSLRSE